MNVEADSLTSPIPEGSIEFPSYEASHLAEDSHGDRCGAPRQEVRWSAAQAKEDSFWRRDGVYKPEMRRVTSRYLPVIQELSAGLEEDSKILDVGCGPTCVSRFFPVGSKTYLDPLMDTYREAYPEGLIPAGERIRAPAERIPKENESYDVVICVNALDHMCDPPQALREMRRVLKSDGTFVLGVFLHPRPTALLRRFVERRLPIFREDAHPHSYTLGSIRSLLSEFFLIHNQVRVFRKDSAWFPSIHREDWMFMCGRG